MPDAHTTARLATLAGVAGFAALLGLLALAGRRAPAGSRLARLSSRVFLALVAGVGYGAVLQAVLDADGAALRGTLEWIAVAGSGYVRLLQLVVTPLVFVSLLAAVVRLEDPRALGAIGSAVVGTLLATTAAAALVGAGVALAFGLRADGLARGAPELARGAALTAKLGEAGALTVPRLLQSFVPDNVVADLAGLRPTSVIGVALVAVLVGIAALRLRIEDPATGARVADAVETLQRLVLRLVRLVIGLTPYGVLALATRIAATSRAQEIVRLGRFVVASYAGLAAVLALHAALLLVAAGLAPRRALRAAWPALTFAFTSRSSAATIPLTIEAQVERLGVHPAIAGFAASVGASVGQNACAGLYPAMLAVMIAPTAGIDPSGWGFVGSVVLVATIGSVGIAGVGGGATFAALVVLSALQLPVALAGVLIAIEPLIDMGRTAVNVSGAITAGAVAQRVLGRRAVHATRATTGGGDAARATADPAPGALGPALTADGVR